MYYSEEKLVQKLNETLKTASKCKFYKEREFKEIKSIKDFEKIPFTTKDNLRNNDPYDLLCTSIENVKEYHESFGTTGKPVSIWYSKKDMYLTGKRIKEKGLQFKEDDVVLMRFPYAISLPAHIFAEAINQAGASFIPVSRGSNVTPYPRVINLLVKLKATVLACNPSEAFIIADVAKALGYDLKKDFNLRAIYTAGELLVNERRLELQEIWGVDVYNNYGMTEISNAAGACVYGNLHSYQDGYYFEVVDPVTHEVLGYNKKGILCVTHLDKEAFPIIRYYTGDIVELRQSECKCGDKEDIIVHYGRQDDVISVGNNEITMGEFQQILYSNKELHERKYWRIKVLEDKLVIYIENEIDKFENGLKLDLPFDYEVKLVKRNTIENIPKLLENSELRKANYFI